MKKTVRNYIKDKSYRQKQEYMFFTCAVCSKWQVCNYAVKLCYKLLTACLKHVQTPEEQGMVHDVLRGTEDEQICDNLFADLFIAEEVNINVNR